MKRAAIALAILLLPAVAHAQDSAPPIEGGDTDQTRLAGQLGGSWSTGNSKSYSANVQTRISHRRGNSQLTWSSALNYGQATAAKVEEASDADAEQYRFKTDSLYYTRLRYDHFFLEKNSVFVAALALRDTSSGFRARYSPYFGYERTFLATKSFELWTDIGYRFSHEFLFLDRRARAEGLPERRWVHGPLLVLGLALKLNETLDLDISLEGQQGLTVPGDFRFFSITNLTNHVGKGFALGMNFNVRYLREPIGDRSPLDTQLQVVALLDHTIAGTKAK